MTIKLTRLDLDYILTQIQMAEAGQVPINPLLSFGLRQVNGVNNNITAAGANFGAAFQPFPTLTTPLIRNAQSGTSYSQTNGLVIDSQPRTISLLVASQNANNPATMTAADKITAAGVDGILGTSDDVFVNGNAAAFAAQQQALGALGAGYQNYTLPGADGIYGTADDTGTTFAGPDGVFGINPLTGINDDITTFGNLATPTKASNSSSTIPGLVQSLFIPNVTPDNGLSAPFNSFFTIFGQFFDHGLDLISKNGPVNGFVFIPLTPDDPLYNPLSPQTNFMVMSRAQLQPGPDGVLGTADDVRSFNNQITPFVDQSQTYASDSSHQAFLREYMIGADGKLHSSGKLLGDKPIVSATGVTHSSLANWADLKLQAAKMLGIKLTDTDVNAVPLLASDAYGNLILGAHGLAQLVVNYIDPISHVQKQTLLEGNLAVPVATSGKFTSGALINIAYTASTTGGGFIDDKAQTADPVDPVSGNFLVSMNTANPNAIPAAGQYNNALLDQHKVAGDGRLNENLGLTAIQAIFHAEHDRIVAQIESLVQTNLNNGDISFASSWVLPGVVLTAGHVIAANEWNGDRVFQAAKFGTETEYMHIVFDEFARMVAPAIHPAGATNVNLNPAITSEFANVVYRFGHSMLDENLNIYQLGADGKPVMGANGQPVMTQEGLIDAFTNPLKYASDPNMSADLIMGMTNQVGNEIDEFVTGTLENNLDGVPLDLAALNIARGRDTGVAPLNLVRNQLFAQTGEVQLKAYTSWIDFGSQLKHIESLANFLASYGTYSTITAATTNAGKVAAAQALLAAGSTIGSVGFSLDAYNFLHSTGAYANNKLNALAVHDSNGVAAVWGTGSITGVDNIDMWIGGLAEKQSLFGGVLGSTFEYVFRTQMEALQDADRLYYLPRIEGTDYEESLQDSSLAQLIRANTDIAHPAGNIFRTPEYTVEASTYYAKDAAGNFILDANGNPTYPKNADGSLNTTNWLKNPTTGAQLVNVSPDGTLLFVGDDNFLGNTMVLGGTALNDKLTAGAADDDTVWGDGGNDVIDGGGGSDFLFGGDGNDTVLGGQGLDTMHGDAGNDTILGGDDIDTIFGGDGNDYIEGGRGDDAISGGLGNDIIIGNEGFDALTGNEGDDWLESRNGQGDLMFGDSGAPTGQQPLYSGNDVMVGGVGGGDIMKGFSGDDIMLGHGSFTKFIGGLGYDWGSYDLATQGVDIDMNVKLIVLANGVDTVRDVWQFTEGVSGSSFDDLLLGDNTSKLLVTKNELDNVNLITGLSGFFDHGIVSFDGGNIMLGGAGNDVITGGGGDDVIDGDAWLHVGLTSYSAGGTIIRSILTDPNGNTYDPHTAHFSFLQANGQPTTLIDPKTFVKGTGHVNPLNVDTAVYNGPMANYDVALFGPDAEGFLTISQTGVNVVVGANPQGLLGAADDTDRIRNIERLQFADGTVAIDKFGDELSSSFSKALDPNYDNLYAPFYDAVPFGTPVITEKDAAGNVVDPTTTITVGNTLTANIDTIYDYDNIFARLNTTGAPTNATYQWQYIDLTTGAWVDINGATAATYTVSSFVLGTLGIRVEASYVDGKTLTEKVISTNTNATVVTAGGGNTAPTLIPGTQFNGIPNTTATVGKPFDLFSPFSLIFTDAQTPVIAAAPGGPHLAFSAVAIVNNAPVALSTLNLQFTFDPTTGVGEFSTLPVLAGGVPVLDPITGLPVLTALTTAGPIAVRVTATDPSGLAVTNTFTINVASAGSGAPVAVDDTYTAFKGVAMTVLPSGSVLANDSDPNLDPFTASLVAGGGPTHGTLAFNADGSFVYTSTALFTGLDKFTYHDTDSTGAVGNTATVTINILNFDIPPKPSTAPEVNATLEDTTVRGTLLAGTDPDGPVALSYSIVAGSATNGTVALVDANGVPIVPTLDPLTGQLVAFNTTGAYVFTPTPNYGTNLVGAPFADPLFGGPATFQYVLNDSLKYSPPKTVSVNVTPVNDGSALLTLTGSLAAGNTLTATLGTDPEGLAPGLTPVFTWRSNGVVVAGVTGSTYALTEADVGHTFQASVTYTDGQNFTSAASTAITNAAGEVFVKPTALATATTVTASNTLVNTFGTPAITGAVTYTWDTSADGLTWTSTGFSGVTYAPVVTGVAGEYIRATANYTDNLGVAQHVASLATHYINDTAPGTLGHTLVGVAGTDIIFAGPGDDVITPGAGNDYVYAGTGNNTIVATVGDGNDIYNGGAGTDTYDMSGTTAAATVTLGGAAPQATSADTGADTLISIENVIGGAGNDTINGDVNNNVLSGGAGNDTLNGNGGNDTLNGGAGDDRMDGGAGNDTMLGGVGNDLYIVDSALDVVTEATGEGTDTVNTSSVTYTLALGSEVEILNGTSAAGQTLTGNEFNNTVTGAGGNDTLFGGAGNDTLNGGAGADTMAGGLGNDTFIVDNAGDVVTEAAGQGTDAVNTSVSYTLTAGSEVEIMNATVGVAGTVGLTLTGNEFDNTVNGAAANDTLFGGAGNDRLNGGAGADAMSGGTGNDTYIVDNVGDVVTENLNEGTDTVNTNLASYTLRANVENLNYTGAGNFAGTGNTLANVIVGGVGNDTLDDGGVGGADTLNGGAGNDTYFIRNAGETILDSGVGVNTVNTTLLSYVLGGNLQNLTFIGTGNFAGTGNAFDNVLTGGAGNDTLSGLAGNDTLTGGAGNDTMTGGAGNDLFKYLAGTTNVGADTITDFTNHNQGAVNKDLIDVSGLGLKVTDFGSKLTLTVTGGNMTVNFAGGGLSGSILLAGQNKLGAAGVDATDFKWAP